MADIGTGSGCIAISLLHELSTARVLATDISSAALQVASKNARRHEVRDRLTLVQSDCFSKVDIRHKFSLIVSNPPYIADEEFETLQREVREHEPQAALRGGADGLDVIRRLLSEAPRFLTPGGNVVFEIGFGQRDGVQKLIDSRVWELVEIRNDYQGIPRVIVLKRNR
jgi:release factor glutamine methyltransferase